MSCQSWLQLHLEIRSRVLHPLDLQSVHGRPHKPVTESGRPGVQVKWPKHLLFPSHLVLLTVTALWKHSRMQRAPKPISKTALSIKRNVHQKPRANLSEQFSRLVQPHRKTGSPAILPRIREAPNVRRIWPTSDQIIRIYKKCQR